MKNNGTERRHIFAPLLLATLFVSFLLVTGCSSAPGKEKTGSFLFWKKEKPDKPHRPPKDPETPVVVDDFFKLGRPGIN